MSGKGGCTKLIFLHCCHFSLQRQTLMNYIKSIDKGIGSSKYQYHINSKILTVLIHFFLKTERFSCQLFRKLDNVNNNFMNSFLIISLLSFDLVICIYFGYYLTLPCFRYRQVLVPSAVFKMLIFSSL